MSYSTDIVLYSVVLLVSSREHFDFLVGTAQGPASLSVSCFFFVHSPLRFLFSPTPGHMDSEASRADRKIFFFYSHCLRHRCLTVTGFHLAVWLTSLITILCALTLLSVSEKRKQGSTSEQQVCLSGVCVGECVKTLCLFRFFLSLGTETFFSS